MKNQSEITKEVLPPLERILVIGNGGRENSLAWALSNCPEIEKVFVAPGNAGTTDHKGCFNLPIHEKDSKEIIEFSLGNKIDLVVIGPEAPLARGLADELRDKGLSVFGPGATGAQLEASKKWAKELMIEAKIPSAKYWSVSDEKEALKVLQEQKKPLVVKADGLAAGKGVVVPISLEETQIAISNSLRGKFGSAGNEIVLEEKLFGPEVSVFALSDGNDFIILPSAQDHKRLKEGDSGPNTGGMGAYAPATLLTNEELKTITKDIINPTIKTLQKRKIDYKGVIYVGLMLTNDGPKVIEYNCRFGDPECQALMPLMGPEFAKVLFACALGDISLAPNLSISKKYSACVVAAADGYPEKPRKGDRIEISIEDNSSLKIFQAGTKFNKEGKIVTSGGRVLSVVDEGEDFDIAFDKVYKGLQSISFEGINYRKDIGHQVRKY